MAREPVTLGTAATAYRHHGLLLDGRPVALRDDLRELPTNVGTPREGPPRRIHLEQYGCAVTQGEAGTMRAILRGAGHEIVDELEEADAAVLVTCTVVDTTERRMVERLEALRDAGVELVVSGCMASSQVEVIKRTAPDALVLPPQYHHQVAELLDQGSVEFCYAPKVGLPRELDGVVATIPINEGCSGRCTFCITKIARPGLRSYPVEGLVADVRRVVEQGAREVRLTSQDSGAYGLDRGTDLPALLRDVAELPGDFRVRVGMMNPFILDRILAGLLDALDHERLYAFLHIPVQSGSPAVLSAMRRAHGVADFERQVARFRERFPDGLVSTDLIVGFPGETEEDHRATVELVERVRPEKVNLTRYSPRDGTPAADLPQVPGGVVKERSRELTEVCLRVAGEILDGYLGRTFSVLVTEEGKEGTGTWQARTDQNRLVVIPRKGVDLGDRVTARIVDRGPTYLVGEVVEGS